MTGTTVIDGKIRVGLSGDFLADDGSQVFPDFDIGPLRRHTSIEIVYLDDTPVISAAQTADLDALIISDPSITADSFHRNNRLTLIARFGVGYDAVDVAACTRNDVALTNTPDGVRRPVAVAILTLILALTQRFPEKQKIAREGPPGWARASEFHGTGLVGKTLGSVGLGNIGNEMFRIARPLEMRYLAYDPFADPARARELDVELVELDELMARSDIVAVNCPLLPTTRNLVNGRLLGLMKPTAYLVNTARGPIVDQNALVDVLSRRAIAGAALDVLTVEPPPDHDPILSLDNVILTPHALCWTDQLFAGCAASNVDAVLQIVDGKAPATIVNKDITGRSVWQNKIAQLAARAQRHA